MEDLDEALRNIDAFCRILVNKLASEEIEKENNLPLEPIEALFRKKYIVEEESELHSSPKRMIPLPQLEEPLIDIIEDKNCVRVLMQERCNDNRITVHSRIDGIEICKEECYRDANGLEVCRGKCQKLSLPTDKLRIENITAKCNNNSVFEVDIPRK